MVQTMKEYQKEYFEKEGYTIIDNMENAITAFCERYPQHSNVAEESILNDTNCDWVVLNDGSVAVLPGILQTEEKPKAKVVYGENDKMTYYDSVGNVLHDGDVVRYSDGREEKLYLTEDGQLGTDATNKKWIEDGRAVPCEYGIYPLEKCDLEEIVRV